MRIEDFIRTPEVLRIFTDEAITELEEQLMILEMYKFCPRASIIANLEVVCEDPVLSVESLEQDFDPDVNRIEKRYSVKVVRQNTKCTVYYSFFDDVDKNAIELEMDKCDVKFIAVTPYNFKCLEDPDKKFEVFNRTILFKRILLEALSLGATDLHFCVEHPMLGVIRYPVKYRVNGMLYEMELFELDAELNRSIISSLIENKTNANSLDLITPAGVTAMSNDPLGNNAVELRIAANKVLDGWQCVIRIQKKETFNFTIDRLGFSQTVQSALRDMIKKRSGIVFITGAIRTGKNTTAFALANELTKQPIKIVSYEYPIEVLMPFTQIDYGGEPEELLEAVRLAKKQDINVAFINELPNKEVAFAVQDLVNSSVYVITTMHVDRIWHLPYKLKEYYGEEYKNIISQINGVFNQKMYQVPCPYCKDKVLVDTLDRNIAEFLKKRGVVSVSVNHGCERCKNTGNVPGKDQPYVEFLEFDSELTDKLLECEQPYQMEKVLKETVIKNRNSFEDSLTEAVRSEVFNPYNLDSIL